MIQIVPISQKEANAFVKEKHRHHKPVVGSKFQIACASDGVIVGVAIVGRPVAQKLDNGYTLEVTRLCTDGTKNACSMLYAAAWRVAKNLGYKRLITYIMDNEPGTTLKAAGWRIVYKTNGDTWNRKNRPRVDVQPNQKRILFEASG